MMSRDWKTERAPGLGAVGRAVSAVVRDVCRSGIVIG